MEMHVQSIHCFILFTCVHHTFETFPNGSITCRPCRGWCSQCVLGLALWMQEWHIQAQLQTTTRKTCTSIELDLNLVSLCDQRKENGRRVPYLVSISFPNVWQHLEDGRHSARWVDGCKTSWDSSQFWGPPILCSFTILVKLHTFSCRPAYRPILHINLHKQMQFHMKLSVSMVVCNVRWQIKTASARAFS